MARELFGTDGIRGVAGRYPLDAETVRAFGAALGRWTTHRESRPEVVLGMDTRTSGAWLAQEVAAGLSVAGARPRFAGVVPTPGVAYLTRTGTSVAGIVVSASHNPFQDNGIKVFDHSGYKLPDEVEHLLEQDIFRLLSDGVPARKGKLTVEPELSGRYLEFLASLAPPLEGFSIAVDCGHGAASGLAPRLFRQLGAKVHEVGCAPDGRNINQNCGALHPGFVQRHVLEHGADLGVAFDGDADRAVFVSHTGKLIDGDCVLLACGRSLHEKGLLAGDDGEPVVVATVMSNLGLEKALAANGIRLLRAPVGDKYVLEEMRRRGAVLGGEQSGHVIFREFSTTGDGLLTALQLLGVMRETSRDLDELTAELKQYPQRLVNVRVKGVQPLENSVLVRNEIRAAAEFFAGNGRVLVRYSGTEPLVRVMVEAGDRRQVDLWAEKIAAAIRREFGAS